VQWSSRELEREEVWRSGFVECECMRRKEEEEDWRGAFELQRKQARTSKNRNGRQGNGWAKLKAGPRETAGPPTRPTPHVVQSRMLKCVERLSKPIHSIILGLLPTIPYDPAAKEHRQRIHRPSRILRSSRLKLDLTINGLLFFPELNRIEQSTHFNTLAIRSTSGPSSRFPTT
jgi:hypothetical protein